MTLNSPFTENVDPSFKERVWSTETNLPGLPDVQDILNSGDSKKIKAFLRSNHWPPEHEVRTSLWWRICQLKYNVSASMYNDLVTDLFGAERKVKVSLPGFVDPSAMHQGHLCDQGVRTAKKIMCILGKSRPDVTHAPTLYTTACILLHYIQEEQVFDTLDSFLRSQSRPILQTRISYQASSYVLKELFKKYNRKLYVYMVQQHIKPEQVLSDWIWWLLRDLPFAYLVRVMDCYLFEGPKVFYRVALAMLRLFYDSKIKGSNLKTESDLCSAISQFCQDMPHISVASLLKASFKIRGFSRKEIQKLVVKQEMYVKSLANTHGMHATMTKSPSCESLNDKVTVSRSFSLQEIGSTLLAVDEAGDKILSKKQSRSQGTVYVPFSKVQSSLLSLTLVSRLTTRLCIIKNMDQDQIRIKLKTKPFRTLCFLTSDIQWETLWGWLPDRVRILVPELIFSTSEHGTSLRTFYSMVSDRPGSCPATIMIIKTTTNELLGAYCSNDWNERDTNQKKMAYFGTGETFVFRLQPESVRYPWVGLTLRENTPSSAQYFQAGNLNNIHIGGGGTGIAITLDEDLLHGESLTSDTFDNPPLAGQPDFLSAAVEVFGFT